MTVTLDGLTMTTSSDLRLTWYSAFGSGHMGWGGGMCVVRKRWEREGTGLPMKQNKRQCSGSCLCLSALTVHLWCATVHEKTVSDDRCTLCLPTACGLRLWRTYHPPVS